MKFIPETSHAFWIRYRRFYFKITNSCYRFNRRRAWKYQRGNQNP